MTQESPELERKDFEEHLQEVTRKRRVRQPAASTAEGEDTLTLSAAASREEVFAPPPRLSSGGGRDGSRLFWMAVGLGGGALLAVLLMAGWLYRQGDRINRLQESMSLLEEQMENTADREGTAGLRAEIAQLNARWNEVDSRVARLTVDSEARRPGGADSVIKDEIDRLDRALSAIEPRLARLEQRFAERQNRSMQGMAVSGKRAKPQAAAAGKGWYIVLASLSGRAAAQKLQRRYREQGVEAAIQKVKVKGKPRYRLRVGPLPGRQAAVRSAAELKKKIGVQTVWLTRR